MKYKHLYNQNNERLVFVIHKLDKCSKIFNLLNVFSEILVIFQVLPETQPMNPAQRTALQVGTRGLSIYRGL